MFLANSQVTINLGVGFVFGILCALVASGRGRNPIGWFFIGLFTSCIGLIILFCLEDLNEVERRQAHQDVETRRLREQLKADRHLGDRRHEEINRRLEVHDRALGVDTSPPPPPSLGAAPIADYGAAAWFFDAGRGERRGPLAFGELRAAWGRGQVRLDTYVWTEGMADWRRVRDLSGLAHELSI